MGGFGDQLAEDGANLAAASDKWERAVWQGLQGSLIQGSTYVASASPEMRTVGGLVVTIAEDTRGFSSTGAAGTLGGIAVGLFTDPVVAGCLDCDDVPSEATRAAWDSANIVENAWPAGYLENILAPSPMDDPIVQFDPIYAASSPTVVDVFDFFPDPISTITVEILGSLEFGSFQDSYADLLDYAYFGDVGLSDSVDYGDYGGYDAGGGVGGSSNDDQWVGDYYYLWA